MKLKLIASLVVLILLLVSAGLAKHYRDNYLHALDKQAEYANLAQSRQGAITDMQTRQRAVAELDAKYTEELASA